MRACTRLVGGLIVILMTASTVGCGGSPLEITNCKDQYGRGAIAPNNVKVTCTPVGSDVECQAVADNSADLYVYCPVSFDVTNQTQWISSDPSVGVFDSAHPGHLRAVGSGTVTVTANYYLTSGGSYPAPSFSHPGFLMNGDAPAERAVDVQIIVFGPSTTLPKPILSGVQITLEPERGPVQSCITTSNGCGGGKLLVVPGHVTVTATKDGYHPLMKDIEVPGTNTSFSAQLDMAPL